MMLIKANEILITDDNNPILKRFLLRVQCHHWVKEYLFHLVDKKHLLCLVFKRLISIRETKHTRKSKQNWLQTCITLKSVSIFIKTWLQIVWQRLNKENFINLLNKTIYYSITSLSLSHVQTIKSFLSNN